MLSSIFVDRPHLAIVIAVVITIAGALALYSIPLAQYPDIGPLGNHCSGFDVQHTSANP